MNHVLFVGYTKRHLHEIIKVAYSFQAITALMILILYQRLTCPSCCCWPLPLQVFNAQTLAVQAQEVVSIAFVSSVVFNGDNSALVCVGGDANCHVLDLTPRQSGG